MSNSNTFCTSCTNLSKEIETAIHSANVGCFIFGCTIVENTANANVKSGFLFDKFTENNNGSFHASLVAHSSEIEVYA